MPELTYEDSPAFQAKFDEVLLYIERAQNILKSPEMHNWMKLTDRNYIPPVKVESIWKAASLALQEAGDLAGELQYALEECS